MGKQFLMYLHNKSTDVFEENQTGRGKRIFLHTLAGILFIIGLFLTFSETKESSVYINLQAENIPKIDITKPLSIIIYEEDQVIIDRSVEEQKITGFTGCIDVYPGAQISVKRIGKGDLKINVSKNSSKSLILKNSEDEPEREIEETVTVIINDIKSKVENGRSLTFPFAGKIGNIEHVRQSSTIESPIIRHGEIYLMTRSVFFGKQYAIGPFPILSGDGVSLTLDSKNKDENISYGFVTVNDDFGVQLVATNQAKGFEISRYMTDKYQIEVNIWRKIYNDQVLTLFWTIFVIFIPFVYKL